VAAGLLHDVQQVVTDLIEVSSNWRGKRRDKGCCATLCNSFATPVLLFSENLQYYSLIKELGAAVICGKYLWLKSSQFIIDIYAPSARASRKPSGAGEAIVPI
jgi:hypothetical protein